MANLPGNTGKKYPVSLKSQQSVNIPGKVAFDEEVPNAVAKTLAMLERYRNGNDRVRIPKKDLH